MTQTTLPAYLEGAIEVPLSPGDRAKAELNGRALYEYNRVKNNTRQARVHEQRTYKETGWVFETKCQAAEIAVANYLGYPEAYIGFSENKEEFQRPDLLDIVEVRRVLWPSNPLRAFTKDVKANALVAKTYYENGTIYIVGWESASVVWQLGQYETLDSRVKHKIQPASTFADAVLARLKEEWAL